MLTGSVTHNFWCLVWKTKSW